MQLQLIKFLAITLIWWSNINVEYAVAATRDTRLINAGCSSINTTFPSSFFANVNETFSELRGDINNQSMHFGTSQKSREAAITYTMFQCRNYVSKSDCNDCFNTASLQILDICKKANGARLCFRSVLLVALLLVALFKSIPWYESERFYQQTNELGAGVACGNKTSNATGFIGIGQEALRELQIATPKINGFYAATKTKVADGSAMYAIAQCVETASEAKCLDCMTIAYNNLQSCLPNKEGSAYDAGCFMRYSTSPFFADNQTINIAPYLKQGGSSKKWAIIGGVVGGVVVLLVLFAWRLFRKPKKVPKADILGATELKGPVSFNYKDLKVATKNFSDDNKLGEGGFGAVYKGTLKNGKVVAVKKLVLGKSSKMEDDFESEAWKLYEKDMQLELVDKDIDPSEYDAEEVKKIIEVALLCTQASPVTRPTMSELIVLLKSKSLVENLRPTTPVFVDTKMMNRETTSPGESNATISISVLSAR
ncbi:hypothetical protein VNO78_38736 [Psophocarpus tetragonolobus]|uniref:Gnk2-homologous domain-containing protein n=1 Tax=Psophocarpus tetragonolobus TaxID=3891 RepID=A0AAN9N5B5_PSOTE